MEASKRPTARRSATAAAEMGSSRARQSRNRGPVPPCPHHLIRRLGWALCALLLACGGDGSPGETFDRFWSDFDTTYSYFEYKQVDWNAGHAGLRQRAETTSSVESLLVVLQDAVTPLVDLHVWFRPPSGPLRPTANALRPPNWDETIWVTYLG